MRRAAADLTSASTNRHGVARRPSREILAGHAATLDAVGRRYPQLRATERPQLLAQAAITRALWKHHAVATKRQRGPVPARGSVGSASHGASPAQDALAADNALAAGNVFKTEEDQPPTSNRLAELQQELDKARAELQALRESSAATDQDLQMARARVAALEEALERARQASAL